MRKLSGVGVGGASVAGPVALMGVPEPPPGPDAPPAGPPAEETERALGALRLVAAELGRRAELAGGEAAEVLEAQVMMAEDPSLAEAVTARTEAGVSAGRAVFEAFGVFRELLAGAGEYMAARVADLDDLAARAVAAAAGRPMPGVPVRDEPFILVAHDLAPADTALLDLQKVLALVTEQGGPTSHTAILARSRGIPAVVGVAGALELAEDELLLVDAADGAVYVAPTEEFVEQAREREAERRAAAARASADTAPIRTPDGRTVKLLANIGGAADVPDALAAGAEGVGLFRTEVLYLGATEPPSYEDQLTAYRAVFEGFDGRTVIARTLDAGADKPLPFLPLGEEPNPSLGVRGIRAFRETHEHLLDTQLAALAAAAEGTGVDLWVMAPMIADATEARWFAAKARAKGIAKVGVMIEVPAAALCAREVLAEVDFASIGTNDLTQYTMAADRLVGALGALQDSGHPAVLKLIAMTAYAGAELGKPVGVCGEAAGDPRLAAELIRLGITSLSMAPAALGEVRAALRT
ncbi:MAG TPA: phosphoenolpyruvate--protein phosphotransferase [Actinospica sp.]|nr:phosphoenolpyruvate--protein phosphotransferase [Actinospica sp.]